MSMARPVIGALAAPRPATSAPTRTLHAVSPTLVRRRRPKIFFAVVTVVTILIIIVAQILLSVALHSGAYEIAGLQRNVKELGRTYQSATQDLNRMTSPQNVAHHAEALGMVANSNPVYLRLSDSVVTGAATAAGAGGGLVAKGNLVPNAMLADVIAEREAAAQAASATSPASAGAAGTTPSNVTQGSAPAPLSPVVAVPSPQGLPSPTTR
jgi:cell division protein FtsL